MKRYGNLYEKIYDMDNLYEAHRNARKDKLFYKEVKMVDANPEEYLTQIHYMLKNHTYKVSKYVISVINDDLKKIEILHLPNKTTYYVGDKLLNLDGGKIKLFYFKITRP